MQFLIGGKLIRKGLLILLLLAPACAPWIRVGGLYESPSQLFSVDIPHGWMRLKTEEYLLISRDGPFLQYILLHERPTTRPFQHTKKRLKSGMLPQEAADVIVSELASDPSLFDFRVLENAPAMLGRRDGFGIEFAYRDRNGLRLRTKYYGLLQGKWFYSLRYTAPQRYYFEKDMETFEKVLKSFKFKMI